MKSIVAIFLYSLLGGSFSGFPTYAPISIVVFSLSAAWADYVVSGCIKTSRISRRSIGLGEEQKILTRFMKICNQRTWGSYDPKTRICPVPVSITA